MEAKKLMILFAIVIGVGALVNLRGTLFGGSTTMATAQLENAMDFNLEARRACVKALAEKAKRTVFDPFTTEGDGKTKVLFTWRSADGTFDKITCTYEGASSSVTSIIVDGKQVL